MTQRFLRVHWGRPRERAPRGMALGDMVAQCRREWEQEAAVEAAKEGRAELAGGGQASKLFYCLHR